MSTQPKPVTSRSRGATQVCALVALVIGVVVLLGWFLGVRAMTSIMPDLLTVKANSAIVLILLGCALALLVPEDASRAAKASAVAFALVGLAWGFLTFLETAVKVNLHFDEMLFREAANAAWTASPGRPPATASLCFVLASTGLLALRLRRTTAMQLLAGAATVVVTASLLTFLLGVSKSRAFGDYYTTIPLLSSVALLALALGLLLARPHEGPMAVFASGGAGGRTARRFAAVAVAIPIIIALLVRGGLTLDLFTSEYGHVVQVTATVLLLTIVVWLLAKWLDRGEQALRESEALLRRERDELERSNAELEQFAYVASHDLQEPLRMVAMYTQLLARRYQGRLDDDADEFIGYAVDGAKRMRELITDLLEFSRVGTRGSTFALTDSRGACDEAVANLGQAIADTGAQVTHDELPTVTSDHQHLVRVFQNLIGNALKFHGDEPPRVHVSAARDDGEWVFSVRDNGIGMDQEYFDRIFLIFQRLHPREDYPGTGIGLALCQRIVARHGGRIWVQSAPGEGATFFFTIPVGDEQRP